MAGRLVLSAGTILLLLQAQMGPPGRPPRPGRPESPNRLAEIQRKVNSAKAIDVTAQRALEYSRRFLSSAEKAARSNQPFAADRLAEAAEALLHVAEHQDHLRASGGPQGPSSSQSVDDHLQRVYFRVQQADYFLGQAHDSRAKAFPQWARDFYQLAVRGYERKDLVAADENGKSAEDLIKALESLAQAATPATAPRPPSQPPGHQGLL